MEKKAEDKEDHKIFNSYQNFDSLGFCPLVCGYRYLRCSCHEMSPERGRRKANFVPSLSFAGPFDSIFIHRDEAKDGRR